MDLYVKDIRFIQLIPKNIKAKTNLNGMLSSNKNLTAEEAVSYIDAVETEKDLATFFAYVDNKAWCIEDDEYDYEEGTEPYKKACEETDKWFAIAAQLKEKIFSILRSENIDVPKRGQIDVLIPFMKRNGFINENGWWIPVS